MRRDERGQKGCLHPTRIRTHPDVHVGNAIAGPESAAMSVVLRQRTVAVVERDLAHTRRGVLLNQFRASDERAEMIEEGAHNRIFCPDRGGQFVSLEYD